MNNQSPILDAMRDPKRADYGLRVGRGQQLNLRAGKRLADKYPDGVRVTAELRGGRPVLTLRNRASGNRWRDKGDGVSYEVAFSQDVCAPLGDLHWGAVAPEKVDEIEGGLVVFLPRELPGLQQRSPRSDRGKGSPRATRAPKLPPKATALQTEPGSKFPAPIGGVAAALALAHEPEEKPEVVAPQIEVRAAVDALNAWKAVMGVNLSLEVTAEGRLQALAQYGV